MDFTYEPQPAVTGPTGSENLQGDVMGHFGKVPGRVKREQQTKQDCRAQYCSAALHIKKERCLIYNSG